LFGYIIGRTATGEEGSAMLDIIRRGQRWVTALFVVVVGGVFAVFIGLGQPLRSGGGNAVVQVGPYRIGPAEFERTRAQREEQFREALGDQFDARAMSDSLDAVTARVLVERAILALEAERLGLTVAKQEVRREILASPSFWTPEGEFDKEAFDRWVAYEFGSERAFREQQRRAALAGKLLRVIHTQAQVSEGEAREAVERQLESVRIAFTVLDSEEVPEGCSTRRRSRRASSGTRPPSPPSSPSGVRTCASSTRSAPTDTTCPSRPGHVTSCCGWGRTPRRRRWPPRRSGPRRPWIGSGPGRSSRWWPRS
jgi:hypothetical protein